MTAQPLVILGAGGLARETAEAVRAVNAVRPTWQFLGFLDDDPKLHGARLGGERVIGPIEAILEHQDAQVLICVGRPDNYVSRERIARRLALDDARYATIVHPSAACGSTVALGAGSVLLSHVDATADVVIGRHVAVMPQSVLTHDVHVEDFATLASGVRLGGAVRICSGAYIGSGACIREGVVVGEWAMVGMASVVTRDVPAGRLWFGSPARDRAAAPLSHDPVATP